MTIWFGKLSSWNNATHRSRRRTQRSVRQEHFDQIKRDHCSFLDRSDFICAFFGDELVGLLKVVYRGQVASILNLLPKASHQDKRPANALVAKALVELCAEKGVSPSDLAIRN